MMGALWVIYICASEVVSILFVMGVTTKRSSTFLGCTILAWGNSVSDLIANITLARQGYHEMGFSACLGGPLFSKCVELN